MLRIQYENGKAILMCLVPILVGVIFDDREEEPQNTNSHTIAGTVKAKQPALSFPHQDDCKTKRTQSTE